MNKIKELYDKYALNLDYDLEVCPATTDEIDIFIQNCKEYNIPNNIVEELVEYYKLNNNFFNYFTCDDLSIFEWYEDQKCLWLGERDMWTFRCLVDKHKYSIGDASNDSFGENYEFDSIYEMLESFLSKKTI